MDQDSLSDWLALQQAPGIGPITAKILLDRFETITALKGASATEVTTLLGKRSAAFDIFTQGVDPKLVDQVLRWQQSDPNHHVLVYTDSNYPALLREISDPPTLLYVWGDPNYLGLGQMAIVGSRNPTPVGRDNTELFAQALVHAGLAVTSGLAVGIDAIAHASALSCSGYTIAVAGTGLDRIYPAQHAQLAQSVASQGAVISEFPLGTAPLRENFPRRNRVISGLSLGTLVVEAALRSGSLITARLALEQGREVFAIPGSIHSPLSRGCHNLIQQGAKLVETANDILEELGALAQVVIENRPVSKQMPEIVDKTANRLLSCMGYDPISLDRLVDSSGLTTEIICSMLLQLELQGWIESTSGGRFLRKFNR